MAESIVGVQLLELSGNGVNLGMLVTWPFPAPAQHLFISRPANTQLSQDLIKVRFNQDSTLVFAETVDTLG